MDDLKKLLKISALRVEYLKTIKYLDECILEDDKSFKNSFLNEKI